MKANKTVMNKGKVEFIDKDGRLRVAVFEREIRRGRHKGRCIVRIHKNGKEKHVKVKCEKLRQI